MHGHYACSTAMHRSDCIIALGARFNEPSPVTRTACSPVAICAPMAAPMPKPMVPSPNNGVLGMVRQWQTLFFDKHYSNTVLARQTDFVKLAEGLRKQRVWAAHI